MISLSPRNIMFAILFICLITESYVTAAAPNTCADSDGGLTYGVQGTVSGVYKGKDYSKTDYCRKSGRRGALVEYFCRGVLAKSNIKSCNCQNGACVVATTTIRTTTTVYIPPKNCEDVFPDSVCIKAENDQPWNGQAPCDGLCQGRGYREGTYHYQRCYPTPNWELGDGCCRCNGVTECPEGYLCAKGGEGQKACDALCRTQDKVPLLDDFTMQDCDMESSAADACCKCVSPGKCTDSDSGKDYGIKGYTKASGETRYYDKWGTYRTEPWNIEKTDSCADTTLSEYYCENGMVKRELRSCPELCVNGVCTGSTTTTTTTSETTSTKPTTTIYSVKCTSGYACIPRSGSTDPQNICEDFCRDEYGWVEDPTDYMQINKPDWYQQQCSPDDTTLSDICCKCPNLDKPCEPGYVCVQGDGSKTPESMCDKYCKDVLGPNVSPIGVYHSACWGSGYGVQPNPNPKIDDACCKCTNKPPPQPCEIGASSGLQKPAIPSYTLPQPKEVCITTDGQKPWMTCMRYCGQWKNGAGYARDCNPDTPGDDTCCKCSPRVVV